MHRPIFPSLLMARVAITAAVAMMPSIAAAICHVMHNGISANSGASWSVPKDLEFALLDPACEVVWVAAGVYKPSGGAFNLNPGVEIYGGFEGLPGSEGDLSVRDPGNFSVCSRAISAMTTRSMPMASP